MVECMIKYLIADGKTYILGGKEIHIIISWGIFRDIRNYDRDVLCFAMKPEKENSVNQVVRFILKLYWDQEDSGYFHNNKKTGK